MNPRKIMSRLVPVERSHYGQLACFQSRWFRRSKEPQFWERQFRHWWDDNPAFGKNPARGWMLVSEKEINGFIGNVPSFFQLNGSSTVANNMTTWHVLPEFRNQSISLILQLIEHSKDTILFNTTPTNTVEKILKAMKFKKIPRHVEDKSVLVVNSKAFLCRNLGKKKLVSPLLCGISFPFFVIFQQKRLHRLKPDRKYLLKEVTAADRDFDQLWERTKSVYPNTNVRTAESINWLCSGSETRRYTVIVGYRDTVLAGYLIFRHPGGEILECVDLWRDPNHPAVLREMLCYCADYAKKFGIESIVIPNFDLDVKQKCTALGLFQMKPGKGRFRIRHGWKSQYFLAGHKIAGDISSENSYFVTLQGDAGLW
jgi:hypothetical protein